MDFLFQSTSNGVLDLSGTLTVLGSALALGLLISLAYLLTHRKTVYTPSQPLTLIMLPAIIAIIIMLVGSNVTGAFSLAGAFSLIRFRTAPSDPKDIAYIFFTVAVGLACGLGYIGYAALFAIVLCAVMVVLESLHFGQPLGSMMTLRITIPESMSFDKVFEAELNRYTSYHERSKIRTSEFGTLFEMVYIIKLKKGTDVKAFLDALRAKNANLNISLTQREYDFGA